MIFATGDDLDKLNLRGFDPHVEGIPLHEVTVRLRKSPWALYGWQALAKAAGAPKRGRDGAARRAHITLHELISAQPAIYVAVGMVDDERCLHAVVWDGWRRLLFLGPGNYSDRELDGTISVEEADVRDAEHVCERHGVTLSAYVYERFGMRMFVDAHVVMVKAKRVAETAHV